MQPTDDALAPEAFQLDTAGAFVDLGSGIIEDYPKVFPVMQMALEGVRLQPPVEVVCLFVCLFVCVRRVADGLEGGCRYLLSG